MALHEANRTINVVVVCQAGNISAVGIWVAREELLFV